MSDRLKLNKTGIHCAFAALTVLSSVVEIPSAGAREREP